MLTTEIFLKGVGLHTGEEVEMIFRSAPQGSGIAFVRDGVRIPALTTSVVGTERNTTLGAEGVVVYTVEHVLAALSALRITDVEIHLNAPEPPALGGCALPIIEALKKGEWSRLPPPIDLDRPIFFSEGKSHMVALPSDEFRVSATIDYEAFGAQFFSTVITPEIFEREIAPCRTFALFEEVEALKKAGLAKGGSLENAVVVKKGKVLNDGGLRFPNELVRHKILDIVGDLSLVGVAFNAHVVAICPGHRANTALAGRIRECM